MSSCLCVGSYEYKDGHVLALVHKFAYLLVPLSFLSSCDGTLCSDEFPMSFLFFYNVHIHPGVCSFFFHEKEQNKKKHNKRTNINNKRKEAKAMKKELAETLIRCTDLAMKCERLTDLNMELVLERDGVSSSRYFNFNPPLVL